MEGQPVWLASVSLRDGAGRIKPSETWKARDKLYARGRLAWLLAGVGDPARERCFRMAITLCLHRALTAAEVAKIGGRGVAVHLAGGPLEVLWQRGCDVSPSTQPCERPRRQYLDPGDRRLYIPIDCGECSTCRARSLVQRAGLPYRQAVAAGAP